MINCLVSSTLWRSKKIQNRLNNINSKSGLIRSAVLSIAIEEYPDCEVLIFNRNGTLIFQSIGYPKSKWWNGTSKSGKDVDSSNKIRFDEYNKTKLKEIEL